jgi:phosphate transport system permease protein
MLGLMSLSVLIAVVPLGSIVYAVIAHGIGAIHSFRFFTQPPPGDATSPGGGLGNAIVGTSVMVALASVVFIPLGILGGVYLVEFGRGSLLARAVRFFAEVMTGIPSIIFGIFVYTMIDRFSAFAGALAIGLIMWPIVVRTSEEMLLRVHSSVREASLALGIPRWKTVLRVILPTAAAGLTTGSMLAVARAAGETAPLLFTALGNQFMSFRLDQPISALPIEVYSGATSAYAAQQERAWAGALVLIALVLALTLVARFVAARRSV